MYYVFTFKQYGIKSPSRIFISFNYSKLIFIVKYKLIMIIQ